MNYNFTPLLKMARSPYLALKDFYFTDLLVEPTIFAYSRESGKVIERTNDTYIGTNEEWNDARIRGKCFHSLIEVIKVLSPQRVFKTVNSGTKSAEDYFFIIANSKISVTSISMFQKSKEQFETKAPPPSSSQPIVVIKPQTKVPPPSSLQPIVVIEPQTKVPPPSLTIVEFQSLETRILPRRKTPHTSAEELHVKSTETTVNEKHSGTSPKKKSKKTEKTEIGPAAIQSQIHPIRSRCADSSVHLATSMIAANPSGEDAENPKSIFGSTKSVLQQQCTQTPADISKIDMFDQNNPSFLNKRWLEGLNDPRLPTHWNPVASIYSVLLYVHQILQWPLLESRVVVHYGKPAFRLSTIADKIFKHCNIEDRLPESDPIIKLLVWCILSMKTYGIIRPIIFKAATENGGRLTDFCAYRHRRDCILVYATWPFRVDSDKLYWIVDQSKLKEVSLKTTILNDLHIDKKPKKMLKDIPDWVYKLCGTLQKN